jgi:predicted DNA-binding protein YlxM (UPF0122 family)
MERQGIMEIREALSVKREAWKDEIRDTRNEIRHYSE